MARYELPKRRRIFLMRHGDVTYFDDSGRAIETARRVLAETSQSIDPEIWPEWQEIRGGKLKDLTSANIERAFLSVFDGVVPEATRFLGGEKHRRTARPRAARDGPSARRSCMGHGIARPARRRQSGAAVA